MNRADSKWSGTGVTLAQIFRDVRGHILDQISLTIWLRAVQRPLVVRPETNSCRVVWGSTREVTWPIHERRWGERPRQKSIKISNTCDRGHEPWSQYLQLWSPTLLEEHSSSLCGGHLPPTCRPTSGMIWQFSLRASSFRDLSLGELTFGIRREGRGGRDGTLLHAGQGGWPRGGGEGAGRNGVGSQGRLEGSWF